MDASKYVKPTYSVKPLHEHKKRLEAEVAAKAEELRKAREELDSYLATLKELMGG